MAQVQVVGQTQVDEPKTVIGRGERHRNVDDAREATIVLGAGDRLDGRLTISSNLIVQDAGVIDGELISAGDVTIENGAIANARVECRNLTVRGALEGDVEVSERLRVSESGTVQGNIRTARLQIEDGAILSGSITTRRDDGE